MADFDIHLTAIAAGDANAFAAWVAGSETRVRLSLSRFAAQLDVESVVQETLMRVWQVAPRFSADGRPNSLLRFAVRVARNLAISELRRLAPRAEPPPQHDELPCAPCEPDPLLRELIIHCREQLPRKPAQALAQRLGDAGASADKELAARVSMQLNTFLQNITRARRFLADCLERQGVSLEGSAG